MTLDEFGWAELERLASDEGVDVATVVAQAWVYYEGELEGDRPARRAPRFPAARGRQSRTLSIGLFGGHLAALKQEADRQGVALKDLLAHAALLYVADVDSGRVAERIARGLFPPGGE